MGKIEKEKSSRPSSKNAAYLSSDFYIVAVCFMSNSKTIQFSSTNKMAALFMKVGVK